MMTRVNSHTVFPYTVWGVLGICLFGWSIHPQSSIVRWFGVSDCYAAEIHTHSKTEKSHTVSNLQLMQWLRKGEYTDLEKYLNNLQAKYDGGEVDDLTLLAAYRSFYPTDPALAARYAEWLKTYPDSYVARLAEGIYYIHVGRKARGDDYISKTSEAQIEGMNNAYRKASDSLMTSLKLDKKPLLSYYWLIDISRNYDSDNPFSAFAGYTRRVTNDSRSDRQSEPKLVSQRDFIDAANRIAPHNFIARRKYMSALETRWGHSTHAMIAFLNECRAAHLPKVDMQILEAAVERDKAWNENNEGALKLAAKHYAAAADLVDNDGMLLSEAGYAYMKIHKYNVAIKYFTRAVQADPDDVNSWLNLGYSQIQLKNMKAAADAYRHAAELGNPAAQDEWGKFLWYGTVVQKDCKTALKLFNKAADKGVADAKRNLYWSKRKYKMNCETP